jgi:hypothetical protein
MIAAGVRPRGLREPKLVCVGGQNASAWEVCTICYGSVSGVYAIHLRRVNDITLEPSQSIDNITVAHVGVRVDAVTPPHRLSENGLEETRVCLTQLIATVESWKRVWAAGS